MKALLVSIVLLIPFSPAACNRRAVSEQTAPQAQASGPTPEVKTEPLELTGVEIHRVKLSAAQKVRDNEGRERVYEQAWLVLLSFKNPPPVRNERMDFYIGDYRVPEYGGFKDGIYFRIYDESLLQSLNDQELSVGIAQEKQKTFLGKKFSTQGYNNLPEQEESAILKRQ